MIASASTARAAFGYYAHAVLRNRIRIALSKLVVPRYLTGALIVAALLVAMAGPLSSVVWQLDLRPWLILFTSLQIAEIWISMPLSLRASRIQRGLAFSPSEVELLFPAPLPRRALMLFKIAERSRAVLVTTLVFALLSLGTPGVSLPRLALGWFFVASLVGLHTLLLHTVSQQLARTRFAFVPGLISALTVLAIAFLVWRAFAQAPGGGVAVLSTPAAGALTWLATHLLAPAYSGSWREMASTLWLPLLLWGLHLLLLVAWSPRVEEVPHVSAGRSRNAPRLWSLAAEGPVWRAIAWKNVVAISRRNALTAWILVVFLPAMVFAVRFAPEDYYVAGQFITVASFFVFIGYAGLVAPCTKVAGLRLDVPHFALLKSMPISARQLLFGEVVGAFSVVYGTVLLVFLVWTVAYTGTEGMPITAFSKLKAAVMILPFLGGWIFIQITLRNLMLLYFPAFASFDAPRGSDYERTGQKLLGYIVHFAVLLLFALPAAIVGVLAYLVAHASIGMARWESSAIAINLAAIALLAESLLLIHLSQERYRDFDIAVERYSPSASVSRRAPRKRSKGYVVVNGEG
ncbi:MAG: hypothetical protein IRZ28_12845 [Steroidobacteraceae bacterium]|nr:hypothetical protein [Steroidobacteraceae bacterium]